MADKDYTIRLTTDASGAVSGIDKVEASLKGVSRAADNTGKAMSTAMREARTGVIGVVNDLTGGLASKFMDVKDAIGGATVGMKGFKAALIGTGIGALVVALGALVGYKDELVTMFYDSAVGLSDLNKQAAEATRLSDELKNSWGLQERALRAMGVAEGEIMEQRKKSMLQQIEQAELAATLAKEAAIQAGMVDKALEDQGILGAVGRWWVGSKEKAAEQKTVYKTSLDKLAELRVSLLETDKAIKDLNGKQSAEAAQNKTAQDKAKVEVDVAIEKATTLENIEAAMNAKMMEERATARDAAIAEAEARAAAEKDIAQKKTDEMVAIEAAGQEKLLALKEQALTTSVEVLGTLVSAFNAKSEKGAKRQFKLQKAASYAEALISTYLAAQKAYQSQFQPIADVTSPVRGAIAAGIATAQGLARVAMIAKQKFEGGGTSGATSGGGGSFGGGSAGGGFATQSPVAPPPTIQNQQAAQPIQAYVLAGNAMANIDARKKIADQAKL